MARPKKVTVATDLELTPAEREAILAIRSRVGSAPEAATAPAVEPNVGISELAAALVQAIETTRPPTKKTVANRKRGNPWEPKDGSPKLKLKRPFYQHGIEIDPLHLFNETIDRLNKVKPGTYCQGWVKVIKRKDGGYDIDYPVKTAAQRLKLVSQYGISSFDVLLDRLLAEKANPKAYRDPDEEDEE